MPNDAISREAAIEAVTLHLTTAPWKPDHPVVEALKALPADTRWEEMRSHLRGYRQVALAVHDEAYVTAIDHALASMDELDRLAPAPAQDVPKLWAFLLTDDRYSWWKREGDDLWESERILGVAGHAGSASLFVDRSKSDPEALRLYDQDIADAQD